MPSIARRRAFSARSRSRSSCADFRCSARVFWSVISARGSPTSYRVQLVQHRSDVRPNDFEARVLHGKIFCGQINPMLRVYLSPNTRDRRSEHVVPEWDGVLGVIEDQAEFEIAPGGFR